MKVLVFAPHNDDGIGVGGTIAKYAAQGHEVFICEVTKSNTDEEIKEDVKALAEDDCWAKKTIFLGFFHRDFKRNSFSENQC